MHNNGGIEDILIGREEYQPKKSNKGKFFIVFLLLCVIACGAYYYYNSQVKIEVSKKNEFINYASSTNINTFFSNEIYDKVFARLKEEDSQITSKISFSNTLESEFWGGLDISKVEIDLLNEKKINKSDYKKIEIDYSLNKIAELNILETSNEIGIQIDDVTEKYIGSNINNLNKIFTTSGNIPNLLNFKNSEELGLTQLEGRNYIKEQVSKIINNLGEENFEINENFIIEKDGKSKSVTAYTMNLNQQELEQALENLIKDIKNDNNLLSKISSKSEVIIPNITVHPNVSSPEETKENSDEEQPNAEVPNEEIRNEENQENNEMIQESEQNIESQEERDPNLEQMDELVDALDSHVNIDNIGTTIQATVTNPNPQNLQNSQDGQNVDNGQVDQEEQNQTQQENLQPEEILTINDFPKEKENVEKISTQIEELFSDTEKESLLRLLLGKKLNLTKEEIKNELDEILEEIKQKGGKGLSLTIYVSAEGTEKVNIILPNKESIEIEFSLTSSRQNDIKITYLDNVQNGFSLEISKIDNVASSTIKATYGFIENQSINKKIIIDLKTEGTSHKYTNNTVIRYLTNQGETEMILDNEIYFSKDVESKSLNTENCLFLDNLSEEERHQNIQDLDQKFLFKYRDIKEELNFIDTNTHTSIIESNSNQSLLTKSEAEAILIDKVSTMMGEAQAANQEFTIQNLTDLKIDGYEVKSTVTPDEAIIVIDIYMFSIDNNFIITNIQ